MESMFNGCTSLISLDLSYFNNSLVSNMDYMIYSCTNLEYNDLKNFRENKLDDYAGVLLFVLKNDVICINENIIFLSTIYQRDIYIVIINFLFFPYEIIFENK